MTTLFSSGTQVATGAEDTLADITATGTFTIYINRTNMALGDSAILRVKTKVLSGDTADLIDQATLNIQSSVVVRSLPYDSDQQLIFTLEQTAGTNRSYTWKVMQNDA